ncbi:putative B3 domain-containing protein At3g24850 [Juglans microcarpa x Juglans regia]|uniref:putative B3 domain-containing protein At3g24850 n=1 Tax=Juglans microcarpa x Juglans regia TaxID=2249226 RepID=UPI001B7E557A|nr:putative B3 domain-containing protein At3g24850 [Juglans microcarpa x Juglans regia]
MENTPLMLSFEDFVGRYVHGPSSPFEMLVDVTQVAAEIYVKEKAIMKRRILTRENLLKKPATTTDDDHDVFEASDPWLRVPISHASSSRRKRSYARSEMGDTDSKIKNQEIIRFQTINGGNPRSKKNLMKNIVTNVSNRRQELPEDLKNRIKVMDGTGVVMVIQKALTATDVKKCQARLSMPFGQINMDFLREGERDYLRRQNDMEVPFIEPSDVFSKIVLRQWDMRKTRGKTSSMYVLRKCWHDVTLTNDLQDGDVVQVWSFRVGNEQRLCLALVVVNRKKDQGSLKNSKAISLMKKKQAPAQEQIDDHRENHSHVTSTGIWQ